MDQRLDATIEAILSVANRPLTAKQLADAVGSSKEDVDAALADLAARLESTGVRLVQQAGDYQLATSPDAAAAVQAFLKDETTGELTKPSLETLTIVAYRGPISKAELEQVRGVNCSLILRNLMMRGLVEVQGDPANPNAQFSVTVEFIKHLGLSKIDELPEYETLRSHENVSRVLAMGVAKQDEPAAAE